MSLQSRNVPVEEVQRVQKSLWRQSSAVKDAIRDAAGRVLEHVRSRETFLLEQVELLEHAKLEMLMENLVGADGGDTDADMNEAIVEFASMELGVETGFRTLCDAIANFGPEMLNEAQQKPQRQRVMSSGSCAESDFCVLDDESCPTRDFREKEEAMTEAMNDDDDDDVQVQPLSHFAALESSPLSEWLLDEEAAIADRVAAFKSFFGEASRYALDFGYWLKEEEEEEMDDDEVEEEEEEQVGSWEKWLHPSSINGHEAEVAFFSEYMRFLRQSSLEDWMKDAPAAVSEIHIPAPALIRTEALTTTTEKQKKKASERSADGWLLKSRPAWHQLHPHHYGECADSCRVLPEESAQMEIENIGNLACLIEASPLKKVEGSDEEWLLKSKKGVGKMVVSSSSSSSKVSLGNKGRGRGSTLPISEWLIDGEIGDVVLATSKTVETARASRSQSDVSDWLKSTEDSLVKGLCKANEPCPGFSGCLSDINCKKGKAEDDEEKEKEDGDKEEKDSSMDSDSDEWVMPKKAAAAVVTARPAQEEKISRFLSNLQATTQDFWLTS